MARKTKRRRRRQSETGGAPAPPAGVPASEASPPGAPGFRLRPSLAAMAVVLAMVIAAGALLRLREAPVDDAAALPAGPAPVDDAALERRVEQACATCHRFPPPDVLPRAAWASEVAAMFEMAGRSGGALGGLGAGEVAAFYQARAPVRLPLRRDTARDDGRLAFVRRGLTREDAPPTPAVSNVNLAPAGGAATRVYATDMRHGLVMTADLAAPAPALEVVASLRNPCKTELADLDGDGRPEILVADLGSFEPGDHRDGSVVVLRDDGAGGVTRHTILEDLGRVTDMRPADFDADGDLDLVVAVFGWRETGQVLWLENRTVDWAAGPIFTAHPIDPRRGAIHVPVADLDGDGRMDFVALFAQEHEAVVAFINTGDGGFDARVLYEAPHPNWGYSSLELVDVDGDGDLDALVANGDTLDDSLLKPYHGLRWLENTGSGRWRSHELAAMYGVHRAVGRDMDGDGDLDVVASGFLPQVGSAQAAGLDVASLVWLEQTGPGVFETRVIERLHSFHPTLDVGDLDGDGDLDVVTGSFTMGVSDYWTDVTWLETWENQLAP